MAFWVLGNNRDTVKFHTITGNENFSGPPKKKSQKWSYNESAFVVVIIL